MILEDLGVLSEAQALTANGTDQSTNIIDLTAAGANSFGPGSQLYLDIEAVIKATGDSSDTLQIDLIMADSTDLDNGTEGTNFYTIRRIHITNIADPRIAAIGRKICSGAISDQIYQLSRSSIFASACYLGLQYTLSAGAALTVNAAISPSKPKTEDNVQVVRSNVSVPT